MKKRNVVIGGAVLFLGSLTSAGCSTGTAVRSDWEAALRGGLGPDCHSLEHLGYGIHYDIVINPAAAPQETRR